MSASLGQDIMNHLMELAEAWRTGALRSSDGLHKDAERSNRNWDLAYRLRRGLNVDDTPDAQVIAELQAHVATQEKQLAQAEHVITIIDKQLKLSGLDRDQAINALESLTDAIENDGSLIHSDACGCDICEAIAGANAALRESPTVAEIGPQRAAPKSVAAINAEVKQSRTEAGDA